MPDLQGVIASAAYSRLKISTVGANNVIGTAGAVSIAVPWPTSAGPNAADVRNLMAVALKPGTANAGAVATPAGWTLVASHIGGGFASTLGAGTGNTRIYVFQKDADNTTAGTVSVSLTPNGASGIACAVLGRFKKDPTSAWEPILSATGEATVDTYNGSFAPSALRVAVGDVLFYGFGMALHVTGSASLNAGASPGLVSMTPSLASGPGSSSGFAVSCVSSVRRARRGLALPTQLLMLNPPTGNARGAMVVARLRVR